jgi:Flagellar P-ring protein/HEAT repeats
MNTPLKLRSAATLAAVLATIQLGGCKSEPTTEKTTYVAPIYQSLPTKEVPAWLRGSVFEQVDLTNTDPYPVSGFGLVVNLNRTGSDANIPSSVRQYMTNEMAKRGVGSPNLPGFEKISPGEMLRDPRVSIVRVDAFIPPGARKDQRIDVQVTTLPGSSTTSLAGGELWLTDLSPRGANTMSPGSINPETHARGPIFSNPEYTFDADLANPEHRRSLTSGVIIGGGKVAKERPLAFRIRAAERRMSRMVEDRLNIAFRSQKVATAHDEGLVFVRVPFDYDTDVDHFVNVALHTFFNSDPSFAASKAREIAQAARQPDAPLGNISYALEALGTPALPVVQEMMADPNPDIAFAAARAAAFIGDPSAPTALAAIARVKSHPFRLNAIQSLSKLRPSPAINQLLRPLVDDDDAQVRIAAARALVNAKDSGVFTTPIGDRFFLDQVPGNKDPIVFATRSGVMRIMLIGKPVRLTSPVLFTADKDRLSISGDLDKNVVTMFYRGLQLDEPVSKLSQSDLIYVIARLAGEGDWPRFDFNYGQVVALLTRMADQRKLTVVQAGVDASKPGPVNFVLQDAPKVERATESVRPIDSAPASIDAPATPVSSRVQ